MTPEEAVEYVQWFAKNVGHVDPPTMLSVAKVIESQAARIAELERDAARYRWLRERGTSATFPRVYAGPPIEAVMWVALDAAIDAAMQASPTPPQPQPEPDSVPRP